MARMVSMNLIVDDMILNDNSTPSPASQGIPQYCYKTAPVPDGTGAVHFRLDGVSPASYFTVMLMILSPLAIFFTTSMPLMTLPKTA